MDKEKVKLRNEKETLLIPLYCKYLESQKDSPIIKDEKAIEMVNSIAVSYTHLTLPTKRIV